MFGDASVHRQMASEMRVDGMGAVGGDWFDVSFRAILWLGPRSMLSRIVAGNCRSCCRQTSKSIASFRPHRSLFLAGPAGVRFRPRDRRPLSFTYYRKTRNPSSVVGWESPRVSDEMFGRERRRESQRQRQTQRQRQRERGAVRTRRSLVVPLFFPGSLSLTFSLSLSLSASARRHPGRRSRQEWAGPIARRGDGSG